jgi:hypothetical protein
VTKLPISMGLQGQCCPLILVPSLTFLSSGTSRASCKEKLPVRPLKKKKKKETEQEDTLKC